MRLATQAFLVVLFSITSLNVACPSIPEIPEVVEGVEGASTSGTRIAESEGAKLEIGGSGGSGPEEKNPYIHLFPKDGEVVIKPKPKPLTIEEKRIKYGQSWGPGGKAAKWVWRNVLKPYLIRPLKRVWNISTKRVIKLPEPQPKKMTPQEIDMIIKHLLDPAKNTKEGLSQLEKVIPTNGKEKSAPWYHWFRSKKNPKEPQTDPEKEKLLKEQIPSSSSNSGDEEVPPPPPPSSHRDKI